jgi:hypothetical protein
MVLFYGGWLSQFFPAKFYDASGQVEIVRVEMCGNAIK